MRQYHEPAPHILKSNRFKLSDFVSRTKTCRFLEGYSPSKINHRWVSFQSRDDLRIHFIQKGFSLQKPSSDRPFFRFTLDNQSLGTLLFRIVRITAIWRSFRESLPFHRKWELKPSQKGWKPRNSTISLKTWNAVNSTATYAVRHFLPRI